MLAATVAVAAGGAFAGGAIGSTPMVMKGIGSAMPSAELGPSDYIAGSAEEVRQPDHYPLVTPEGTVPVAELALRGRLRDTRHAWSYGEPEYVPADSAFPEQYSEADLARLSEWEPQPGREAERVAVHRGSDRGTAQAPRAADKRDRDGEAAVVFRSEPVVQPIAAAEGTTAEHATPGPA